MHGQRFIDEYPDYGEKLSKLYLERQLDDWYKEKCKSEFILPDEMYEIQGVSRIEVRNKNWPSTEIYISLNELPEDSFTFLQEIQIRLSKVLPLYEMSFLHSIKHESLESNLDLWGPPQTFELLKVVDVIRDILSNLGYQELSELYDLHDTIFEWHELKGIDEVNRRLILKDAIFTDVLELCN
ncbi:hypothetical protein YSY43_15320 [Paenibacillus sp. YSY-4.3]